MLRNQRSISRMLDANLAIKNEKITNKKKGQQLIYKYPNQPQCKVDLKWIHTQKNPREHHWKPQLEMTNPWPKRNRPQSTALNQRKITKLTKKKNRQLWNKKWWTNWKLKWINWRNPTWNPFSRLIPTPLHSTTCTEKGNTKKLNETPFPNIHFLSPENV